MRLRRLEIENFRVIKSLDWRHIGQTQALIGPGDSGKSTILDAVERVFSPRWNVTFDDTDFWSLDVTSTIRIRATVTDLPDALYSDTKFGLHLHAFNDETGKAEAASGSDDEEYAVVFELSVDSSLEPRWNVVDAQGDEHALRAKDRELLGVLRVGGYVDQHFGWARGSLLSRLTQTADEVSSVLAEAARSTRSSVRPGELTDLVAAANRVQQLGSRLGVNLGEELQPNLDASSLSVSAGALSLHSGNIPVRRSGLGSRRLLAIAMQRGAATHQGLTLVDEFEHGLEPHRIRQLLRALRGRHPAPAGIDHGQLILTTHSPPVISELDAEEVAVSRRDSTGRVSVHIAPEDVDYIIRRTPEALLAKKVVVGEGDTEAGLISALDKAWEAETGASFGYLGAAVVDGIGSDQPARLAGHLSALGYETALLIDSDAKPGISRAGDATVLAWSGRVCTEERLALDLPEDALRTMTSHAVERASFRARDVRDSMADALGIQRSQLAIEEPEAWLDLALSVQKYRAVLGDVLRRKGWLKGAEGGEFLGGLVVEYWSELADSPTRATLDQLREFVHG